eukprot:GFUD01037303.1.p1 GENE.GFUD01037303.1~~GFUD01037303.1.p1  ORF type:complete len:158 (-),score=35.81 GFUD01037303.1:592-1065(-)
MAGVKSLVALAFSGSIGLLFLFLACALPQFNNWYPFTVVIFYLLSPIPTLIAKRHSDDSSSNPCRELAWFLTTGIVVSAFALPIVLARAPVSEVIPTPGPIDLSTTTTLAPVTNTTTNTTTVIEGVPAALVTMANLVMFITIGGFFFGFEEDTSWGY